MSEEAKILLRHPDYRERLLALKLDSVTPEDVSMAILDPHEEVFNAAFHHPLSNHALNVLASVSRDAAGNPISSRHIKLLSDPRCHNQHIESMKRAVEGDTYLPIKDQSLHLKQIESRLTKHEPTQINLDHADLPPTQKYIKVAHEENPHPELLQAYNSAVNSSSPIHPQDADLHDTGQASPKVIYNTGEHKFLVKPYFEYPHIKSGWGELTSQELYKAAEIPHLHQKVFPASYKNSNHHVPVVVIKIEKAKPVHKATSQEFSDSAKDDARKIAVMDFLTGNNDRHANNLMVRDNGTLLAIDHGLNHCYQGNQDSLNEYVPKKDNGNNIGRFTSRAPSMITLGGLYGYSDSDNVEAPDYHSVIRNWWPNVSADVKRAFNKRLDLVENEPLREHLERGFNARHQWLDNAANGDLDNFLTELKKAVKIGKDFKSTLNYRHTGLVVNPEPPSPETDSIHKELLSAHPSSLQPQVDDFETYVNHPTHGVTPEKGNLSGVEEKILVSNRGNKHLIKNGSLHNGTRSGWNKLTSQAMYHAGGIGHLHQKVHATKLNIKEGNKVRQQNAIVIHFKPGKWTPMYDFKPGMNPGLNLHGDDLRKAALMDFVTNNDDRHGGNIVFGENWEPQVIDHGYAFSKTRVINMGDNEIVNYAGYPDQKTYDWWKTNKGPIVAAFNKHVSMIPDKEERNLYKSHFRYMVDKVDEKHPEVFGDNLVKALGSGDFLHNQHTAFETQKDINLSGVHEKLAKSHPPIVTPGVRHFEITLNNNKNTIEPKQEQDEMYGLQPKALYESGGNNIYIN